MELYSKFYFVIHFLKSVVELGIINFSYNYELRDILYMENWKCWLRSYLQTNVHSSLNFCDFEFVGCYIFRAN